MRTLIAFALVAALFGLAAPAMAEPGDVEALNTDIPQAAFVPTPRAVMTTAGAAATVDTFDQIRPEVRGY